MSNPQGEISGSEAPLQTPVVRVDDMVPLPRSAPDMTPTSAYASGWARHGDYVTDWVHDRYLDGC